MTIIVSPKTTTSKAGDEILYVTIPWGSGVKATQVIQALTDAGFEAEMKRGVRPAHVRPTDKLVRVVPRDAKPRSRPGVRVANIIRGQVKKPDVAVMFIRP